MNALKLHSFKALLYYRKQLTTVVILINATTLTHKSTLSTNTFGNKHFGQKYLEQNILEYLRDYNGVFSEKFQRTVQNYKMRFWPNFPFFWEFQTFKKTKNGFYSSIDACDVSATADIICRR